jgi:RND family efflux transporter MFP subunit
MMRGETMTAKAALISLALSALFVTPALLGGCGRTTDQETQSESEVLPVETAEVVYSEFSPTLSYTGTVLPGRKALLGAEIQGRVQTFHVDTGDDVRAGDLLVELAGGQLTQAEAQYRAAEKDWQRMKALLDEGAVTQQAFDHADAAHAAAKAAYETVLESARIRAPFDGVITARYLDEGELFVMMSPSPAILEISNMDEVKIEIEIAESERGSARTGLAVLLTVDALPGAAFGGQIDRLDPGLDEMTRTSTAEIILENPGGRLRPGMFADVELTLAPREALLMPREALVRQEGTGSFFAYVVEDGVAHRRDLKLGDGVGGQIEVLSGLAEGEPVVTAGRYRLYEGARVAQSGTAAGPTRTGPTASGAEGEDTAGEEVGR